MLRRADQHLRLTQAVGLAQGHAADGVAVRHLEADHVDAAPGEGLHAEGGGEGQDPGDLLGGGQIGVDDHVQADLLFQHFLVPAIVGVADTGDGVARPQLFGDQAAHQVDLVLVGDGDDQVGGADTGLDQHADAGAVALYAQHVHGALRLAQGVGVGVHHDDIVILLRQGIGDGISHLAVADNDNFHNAPPVGRFLPPRHIF